MKWKFDVATGNSCIAKPRPSVVKCQVVQGLNLTPPANIGHFRVSLTKVFVVFQDSFTVVGTPLNPVLVSKQQVLSAFDGRHI